MAKKILIHNEPNMQEVIQACLTAFAAWNVRVANSTLEGVQQAILSQPDALIVEVSVGEIDGLRFLKQLRTPPATQGIPVAILTYAASWGDLQQSWFQQYHLPAVIVNPLDPAMLSVQTANVWAWDLESPIKSRNREQGRRNGKKTILCRNGSQKLHLNSVDFSKNRCDITRFVKGAYCGKKILCALKIITKCLNLY